MRLNTLYAGLASFLLVVAVACSQNRPSNPEVEAEVERSLDAAGLRDVSADQDVDKGVVTLTGAVPSEAEKARAEQVAKSVAAGQIVANEIAVRPPGMEEIAKDSQSALDEGIENNLNAALIQHRLEGVDHSSKEGVVTLTGTVDSQAIRQEVEQLAVAVPNVKQVINMIDVKNQKATATSRQ